MSGLNLLTPEERASQTTEYVFKIIDAVFIFILISMIGLSIYSYNSKNKLESQIITLEEEKNSLMTELSNYTSEEFLLRDVSKRLTIYDSFITRKYDSSLILKELYARAWQLNLSISNISFDTNNSEITIKLTTDTDQFTRFINNLKNQNFQGEYSVYPNLFYASEKNEQVNQATKEFIVFIKFRPEIVQK
jgi:hypothetical protein